MTTTSMVQERSRELKGIGSVQRVESGKIVFVEDNLYSLGKTLLL